MKEYVSEEQFHRLIAMERNARISGRVPDGLGDEFTRFMDGLERRLGLGEHELTKRTRWSLYRYKKGDSGPIIGFVKKPFQAKVEKDNYLVSSLCENGMHAPAIDIAWLPLCFPMDVGVILDFARVVTKPSAYRRLMRVWVECGLCSETSAQALVKEEKRYLASGFMPLRCDVATRLVPSSTKNHSHLYLDTMMPWAQYAKLLKALKEINLLGEKQYDLAMRDKMSLLIEPGLTKRRVQSRVRKPKPRQTSRYDYDSGYW